MYKRLIIISVIILAALCGLGMLGYHSINIWSEGLQGARLAEFAKVAETIRGDVKHKLDDFMRTEQQRPYTHYQFYYVPDDLAQQRGQIPLVRSPLSGDLYNGLAYGNFQVDEIGNLITPNDDLVIAGNDDQTDVDFYNEVLLNRSNLESNVLPVLKVRQTGQTQQPLVDTAMEFAKANSTVQQQMPASKADYASKGARGNNTKSLPIESLNEQQKTQTYHLRRDVVNDNSFLQNQADENSAQSTGQAGQGGQGWRGVQYNQPQTIAPAQPPAVTASDNSASVQAEAEIELQPVVVDRRPSQTRAVTGPSTAEASVSSRPAEIADSLRESDGLLLQEQTADGYLNSNSDTVEVRVEPFSPVVVGGGSDESIFGGQVFLIRNVQVEQQRLIQGFKLNEGELIDEVTESAERVVSLQQGMDFELPQTRTENAAYASAQDNGAAYTAILDFGFGYLMMNLMDTDPGMISRQIVHLKAWYFAIIITVLLAVTLALTSLWRNASSQLKLARKKDDFISAVSHELRTPLTSIRMYSEMLENNWVKSPDKLSEYYRNMRQESERLSRLIENVLDFSRIQRGRKKYSFSVGDINECVSGVVEMMSPYAAGAGFSIRTELGDVGQITFDPDAVTQIVVNLLDNAVKYARDAEDKTIIVRTTTMGGSVFIDIEDHGPGIPPRQRAKVFEEFYRCSPESTRETTGTGLGLALVRKFAQAHEGFVEILSAKPTGAVFRVALAVRH